MRHHLVHPGNILQKVYIEPQNLSIKELSKELDIPQTTLTGIIKGKQSITSDISIRLAKHFQTKPEFWIQLQLNYDLSEKSKGTDDPFYKLMKIMGDAMLKLIGVESNGDYEPRAIVLKEKRLYPDIVAFPKNKDGEIIIIEFQGYKEPMMLYIMSSKITMLCTQEKYTGPVIGAIVYTEEKCKKASLPFSVSSKSGKSWIKGEFIEIDLSTYTEKDLLEIDEQLIILAPFTLKKNYPKDEYIKKCRQWKKKIDQIYSKQTVQEIINILSLFILDRQKKLDRKELMAMFNFDISNTKVGQELKKEGIKEGEKKGKKEIILYLFENRFGKLPAKMKKQINQIETKLLDDLAVSLFNFNTVNDYYFWWDKHYSKK